MIADLRINGPRLWQAIMKMAEIDALPEGGCGRLALSQGDKQARDLFKSWCEEAGCSVSFDALGNMFARREGVNNDRLPVAIGSHLDTQPHGGKFDGVYGVLAGLEVVRTLNDNAVQTDAPLEIVNWTNEEGARFAPAMLCSGVYAGLFDLDFAHSRKDDDGVRFDSALRDIGYEGKEACGAHPLGVFLEAHIEQGPILDSAGEPIGVVTGGQGQRWYNITVVGRDAHSGSTPMASRSDALVAAAMLVLEVQHIAKSTDNAAVATVGALTVLPNSRNTIPGLVSFTVDMRHQDDNLLSVMDQRLRQACEDIDDAKIDLEMIWHNPPVIFDKQAISAIRGATRELGYAHREMVSGAGHDACQIARKVPTAMVFVPCKDGLSHNQAESAKPSDLEAGCNVLLHAALRLSN